MNIIHSELREIDDKNIEKLHMDAATGKLRIKRRDRGIGFEDSDSEEEGEDAPLRRKFAWKRLVASSESSGRKSAAAQRDKRRDWDDESIGGKKGGFWKMMFCGCGGRP